MIVPPDARNEAGTLLCICGKPQAFYSGLADRGFCSEACFSDWRDGRVEEIVGIQFSSEQGNFEF